MKWYKKLWVMPMLLLNACASATLLLCAFSQHLPAARLPLVSITGLAFPIALVAVVGFLLFWLLTWKRGCWLPLLTLLVCFSSVRDVCPLNLRRQSPPEGAFKLLSYNINFTSDAWGNRSDSTMFFLLDSGADIICLQECNNAHMRNIDSRTAVCQAYPYRAHIIDRSDNHHNLDCLSKFPIVDVQDIPFDDSGNGAVRYLLLIGSDTLALFNCHLESFKLDDEDKTNYEDILNAPRSHLISAETKALVKKLRDAGALRAAQADEIARLIEETSARYTLVCGDFNDAPVSYAHHRLTRHLRDAHTHSGNGFDFSYTNNRMYFRIDHILASENLHPWHCRVHHDITHSDHHPISAFFTLDK